MKKTNLLKEISHARFLIVKDSENGESKSDNIFQFYKNEKFSEVFNSRTVVLMQIILAIS